MSDIQSVASMYNNAAEYEDNRLKQTPIHELEYALTTDLLDNYIQPNSIVLDLGAGTGIYSEYLIKTKKCKMGLIDISEEELQIFKKKNPNYQQDTVFVKVKSATDLTDIKDNSFDNILVFGPLYHLTTNEERLCVLRHCYRIIKNNGYIICSYISPHRIYKDLLNEGINKLNDDTFLESLKKGITYHTCEGLTAIQYRCWPSSAKNEIESLGFKIEKCRSLEGIFSYIPRELLCHLDNPKVKEKWIEIAKQTSENEDIIGSTLHFSIVGKKCT